jgi:hypothetical protein
MKRQFLNVLVVVDVRGTGLVAQTWETVSAAAVACPSLISAGYRLQENHPISR